MADIKVSGRVYNNVNTIRVRGAVEGTVDYGATVVSTAGDDVKLYDYDGTVVQSYSKEGFLSTYGNLYNFLPPPSHTGLTLQGWTVSVGTATSYVTRFGKLDIGAIYTTTSGKNEFIVEVTRATGLSVTLSCLGVKDWGDGSSDNLTTHTYQDYGTYTITCDYGTDVISPYVMGQSGVNYDYLLKEAHIAGGNIPDYAFYCCKNLRFVTMANEVTYIGEGVFAQCDSLNHITIPSNNSLTEIQGETFETCVSLKSVCITDKIALIRGYAFQGCNSLKRALFVYDALEEIKKAAFSECLTLETAILPSNRLPYIAEDLFYGCYSLKEISIPLSITYIYKHAFGRCYSLKSVKFSDSVGVQVSSIWTNAFEECYSLEEITLPSSISNIEAYAFTWCLSMKKIVIPSTANSLTIAKGAFDVMQACIYYDFSNCATVPILQEDEYPVFLENMNKGAKIIVPDALYNTWVAAQYWSNYADYIYRASEVSV